jgi:glycerol-3-phosphate dehydrogenase subunit B
MFYDVIVIGAGLSGLMAAQSALDAGAKVLLLAKGLGSLPLTTGCIDILGYLPGSAKTLVKDPSFAIGRLSAEHPYQKVGAEGVKQALGRFQEIVKAEDYPYAGCGGGNFLIPTSLGTPHPTGLVPQTLGQGDLSAAKPVLLVGFEGLKDFSPHFAAQNLNLRCRKGETAPSFRPHLLKRPDMGGKSVSAVSLAAAFEKEEFRISIAGQIARILRPGERIGLPAVMGLDWATGAWADLQKRAGAPVFEVPLPPPSIPGLRLQRILTSHFQGRGGRVFVGFEKAAPLREKKRIVGLALGDARKNVPQRAAAFVLATGQFFGGGLDSERNRIFETLLGLPVRHPESRKEWFRSALLSPAGHPFNAFGVEVDQNLNPLDFQGEVVYENVFAAGGILAHGNSPSEKSGGGIAVSTGYWAGKYAAAFAKKS